MGLLKHDDLLFLKQDDLGFFLKQYLIGIIFDLNTSSGSPFDTLTSALGSNFQTSLPETIRQKEDRSFRNRHHLFCES